MSYIPGHSPSRGWRELRTVDTVLALAAVFFLILFCVRLAAISHHIWDWGLLWNYVVSHDSDGTWKAGMLLRGVGGTLRLGMWALLTALFSGISLGMMSAHVRGIAAYPIRLYITVLRNTPPLVLLFLVYFFAGSFFSEPLLHLEEFLSRQPFWIQEGCAVLIAPPGQLDRMLAAILTLGLYSGAYVAEIVRGALESVDRGQWDASASLGMNSSQQMRWVIFPQAFRIMIPSLTGQTIAIFKETALASVISLPELTFQSLEVMAVTRMTFELWLLTAGLYLLISCCWGWLGRYLERKQPR